jgi:hypothetical protein
MIIWLTMLYQESMVDTIQFPFFGDSINGSMLFPVQQAHTFWFRENQSDAMFLFSSVKS